MVFIIVRELKVGVLEDFLVSFETGFFIGVDVRVSNFAYKVNELFTKHFIQVYLDIGVLLQIYIHISYIKG